MKTFNRYAGADDADQGIAMPQSQRAHTLTTSIGELISSFESHFDATLYPWADRFVMGLPLPSWQRPAVWTPAQQVRFIESMWAGLDLGSYLVNEVFEFARPAELRQFSDALLDGQQRLFAIECYLLDKIAVPDALGKPRLWSELPKVERRRFSSITFARSTVSSYDEAYLRKVYDLRAFGGTPHSPDQRAGCEI